MFIFYLPANVYFKWVPAMSSGSGLSHSEQSFLLLSICQQISQCHCFQQLSNTPLCKCIIFPSSVLHLRDIKIVKNMNVVEQLSLWYDRVSFEYIPRNGILDLEVEIVSVFWETAIQISKVTVQVCTPASNGRMFPLLHTLDSMSGHLCFWT